MNDFTSFANQCKLLDQKYINLSALDLLFVATNVSNNKYTQSAERDLNRYEFFEIMVRTAIFRYKDTKLADTTCKAIEMLLNELIYPNARAHTHTYFVCVPMSHNFWHHTRTLFFHFLPKVLQCLTSTEV